MLRAEGLDVTIAGRCVVRGLDWQVKPGQRWVVLGRNGIGKSTLLATMAGHRSAQGGRLSLDDRPLGAWPAQSRARRLGWLPQQPDMAHPCRVEDYLWLGGYGRPADAVQAAVASARQAFELDSLRHRPLDVLSGGERQRVALATIAVQAPALLLLDEPLNHLDLPHQVAMSDWLCKQGAHHAVVLTIHDVNWARRIATHALLLHGDGKVEQGTASDMLDVGRLGRLLGYPLKPASGDWLVPG